VLQPLPATTACADGAPLLHARTAPDLPHANHHLPQELLSYVEQCHHLLDPINLVTCVYRLARLFSSLRAPEGRHTWRAELMVDGAFLLLLGECGGAPICKMGGGHGGSSPRWGRARAPLGFVLCLPPTLSLQPAAGQEQNINAVGI